MTPGTFSAMRAALRRAGVAQPALVLDYPRLQQNLQRVRSDLPQGMALRIVAKSLPCPQLLTIVCEALGTQRLMTFNLPMLRALADSDPKFDHLLGKPFPVAAAAALLRDHPHAAEQVHWLIDTPARLQQYAELAVSLLTPLNIALELDIGLHRGGFAPGAALQAALEQIQANPKLRLTASMGYEAHVAKVPTLLGWRARAFKQCVRQYRTVLEQVAAVFGPDAARQIVRNAGGSPTFQLYRDTDIANEVALGSVLVKPGSFETDMLRHYEPAAWIATPALKISSPVRTPVLEGLDPFRRVLGRRHAVCIHGGYWKAEPADPPGLRYDSSFGRSSNQEVLVSAQAPELEPDDFVFLRPTQSEALLNQFGPIAVFDGETISEWWGVYPPSG